LAIEIHEVSGSAYARGRQLGTARRKQIQAYWVDWMKALRSAGVADPEAYIAAFREDTNFLPAIAEHTPDLLDEVRGIADGADQNPEWLLASQLMDEEWAYRPRYRRSDEARQKCSSIAIRAAEGPTWIGQNMDLPAYTDGHQTLLHIAPHAEERGALVLTIGGMIGLLGVNARAIGVCVNSLPQLPAAREGLPVAFVIRKLLQAESVRAAVDIIHRVPHATAQHYLIAGPSEMRSFEVSAAGVREFHSSDPSRVLHTNHPLVMHEGAPAFSEDQTNTIARLRALTTRLMSGRPTLEAIKAALCSCDDPDHPVCKRLGTSARTTALTGMASFTTGSMISALQEDSRIVDSWVTAGPPTLQGYTHVRLLRSAPT
jgi:predicted choloylglycine hydrolase